MLQNSTIIGIDPGTNILGFAILNDFYSKPRLLKMGILNLSKIKDNYLKLEKIQTEISNIIQQYKPNYLAIEAPFYGKNVQSMLKLGRAQGVVIATACFNQLTTIEYSPKKIKQAITGNGSATKDQVFKMLTTILNIEEKPEYLDASDAAAVALCHYYKIQNPLYKQNKHFSATWKDFINKNQNRIKLN